MYLVGLPITWLRFEGGVSPTGVWILPQVQPVRCQDEL